MFVFLLVVCVMCLFGRIIMCKLFCMLLMVWCFVVIIFIVKVICFYVKGLWCFMIGFVLIVVNED